MGLQAVEDCSEVLALKSLKVSWSDVDISLDRYGDIDGDMDICMYGYGYYYNYSCQHISESGQSPMRPLRPLISSAVASYLSFGQVLPGVYEPLGFHTSLPACS